MTDLPKVDATQALAETVAIILHSLLELVPISVQQGDLSAMRSVEMLQVGMQRLQGLLLALGSDMVKAEETAPSSIILP